MAIIPNKHSFKRPTEAMADAKRSHLFLGLAGWPGYAIGIRNPVGFLCDWLGLVGIAEPSGPVRGPGGPVRGAGSGPSGVDLRLTIIFRLKLITYSLHVRSMGCIEVAEDIGCFMIYSEV